MWRRFALDRGASALQTTRRRAVRASMTRRRYPPAPHPSLCCMENSMTARYMGTSKTTSSTTPQQQHQKHPSVITARPPGEEQDDSVIESKFPFPDKKKEDELSRLQTQVQELYKAGNYRRGLTLAQQLLKATKSHFGNNNNNNNKNKTSDYNNHSAIASGHNNVGLCQKQLGQFDDARLQYRAALKIYKATVGVDHASYAATLHNLGTLNRTQIHFDTSLKATDRLCLVEESVEYLQEAFRIRANEYGQDHPLTVASRSSWGASLAAQILHYYKRITIQQQHNPVDGENSSSSTSDDSDTTTSSSNNNKTFYRSVLPDDHVRLSDSGWNAAEQHLRQALQTAIEHPRGPSIGKKKTKQPKHQQKQKKMSNNKRQQSQASASAASASAVLSEPLKIETLSAASAAQNLAIFLKSRATTIQAPSSSPANNPDDTETETATDSSNAQQIIMLLNQEALQLYRDALHVRLQLLPETHPDLYATKHSLAELLQATGDEESANTIRQEIVDSYDDNNNKNKNNNNNNNNNDKHVETTNDNDNDNAGGSDDDTDAANVGDGATPH